MRSPFPLRELVLPVLLVLLVSAAGCRAAYEYADIDESFRFEDLAKDPAALKRQVDCYLDRGPCDGIPQHYKTHIREEILHTCAQCDARLKHNIKTFLKILRSTLPDDYRLFRAKYDPTGTLFDRIESLVSPF